MPEGRDATLFENNRNKYPHVDISNNVSNWDTAITYDLDSVLKSIVDLGLVAVSYDGSSSKYHLIPLCNCVKTNKSQYTHPLLFYTGT
jgi:hypothetical protein